MPDTHIAFDPSQLKIGIGQPVTRQEDPKLLRGEGRYTDDISLPGQLHAFIVRSPYAHGILNGVDTAEARQAPGVVAILSAEDMQGYGEMTCALPLKGLQTTRRAPLAHGKDAVTVIVTDFRGLDTLVEVTVLVVAGAGVATLLRRGRLW